MVPILLYTYHLHSHTTTKMKVFNWVSRRLLNAQSCIAPIPDETKKNVYDEVSSRHDVEETQALLEHGAHLVMDIDVLEDWKDGILSIGTLAISPLETTTFKFMNEVHNNTIHHYEHLDHNLTYNNVSNNNMEESPLMDVETFSHELESNVVEIIEEEVTKEVNDLEDKNNEVEIVKDECQTIKKRVTLADLLLEDSNHTLVKQLGDKLCDNQGNDSKDIKIITTTKPCVKMIKPSSRTKQGLSKAKKLLKEDVRPLKKINQLMKRMMKKKIHPDIETKMQLHMELPPTFEDFGSNESTSEILIQG